MYETGTDWTIAEQEAAQAAFNTAYERETTALLRSVRARASSLVELEDLWQLNDFLSARRHELDGKYDYDSSVMLFVFASLVKDGWLQIDELQKLSRDKLAKISALTRV